jgi:hypothetical protein
VPATVGCDSQTELAVECAALGNGLAGAVIAEADCRAGDRGDPVVQRVGHIEGAVQAEADTSRADDQRRRVGALREAGPDLGGERPRWAGQPMVNQFGEPMSLSQFRGKVVILAFVDSECTTVGPLTTVSMVEARQLLGAAGEHVQLLGIDANRGPGRRVSRDVAGQ